jgi:hypothetical protein
MKNSSYIIAAVAFAAFASASPIPQAGGSTNEGDTGQVASNQGSVTDGSGKTQVGTFGNGNDDFSNNGNTDTNVDFAGIFRRQSGDSSVNEGNSGQIASNTGAVTGGSGKGATQVGTFGNGDNDFSYNDDSKTSFTADVGFFKRQDNSGNGGQGAGGFGDSSTNEGNSGQIASNEGNVAAGSGSGATQVGSFGNGNNDFSNNDDSSFKGDFGIFKRQSSGGLSDGSTNEGNSGQISSNKGDVTGGSGSGATQVGAFGNGNNDFSGNENTNTKVDFEGIFKRQDSSTNKNNNGQIASNSGAVTGGAGGPTEVGNFGNGNGKPAGPPQPAASATQVAKSGDGKPAPPAPSQTATVGSSTQCTTNNNGQVAKDSGVINDNGGIVVNGNVGGSVTIIELTGADGTKYAPQVGTQYTAPAPLTSGQWSAVTIPSGHHCMLNSDSDGGVYSLGAGNHAFPKTVSINAAKCM